MQRRASRQTIGTNEIGWSLGDCTIETQAFGRNAAKGHAWRKDSMQKVHS